MNDVVSCSLPMAGGSRRNKKQDAAWRLTSDSDISHGAFSFLKSGVNIRVITRLITDELFQVNGCVASMKHELETGKRRFACL